MHDVPKIPASAPTPNFAEMGILGGAITPEGGKLDFVDRRVLMIFQLRCTEKN
jgi:hypothetical protein